MLADTLLIFDHLTHKIKVVSHVHLDGDIEKSYREATDKIDGLVAQAEEPVPGGENGGQVQPTAQK